MRATKCMTKCILVITWPRVRLSNVVSATCSSVVCTDIPWASGNNAITPVMVSGTAESCHDAFGFSFGGPIHLLPNR